MRGIVEIDIPNSCLECPFSSYIKVTGWEECFDCRALNKTIDILDGSLDDPEDWTTFDYVNERFSGCPIKELRKE